MRRRTFCKITSIALAGTALPLVSCMGPDEGLQRRLSLPTMMGSINEPAMIDSVGRSYLNRFPEEHSAKRLVAQLMIGPDGARISKETDSLTLQDLMINKAKSDYDTGDTVVVLGWVLSRTEARQCALYALNNSIE